MDFHLSMDSIECTCEGLEMITYLFRYGGKIYFLEDSIQMFYYLMT